MWKKIDAVFRLKSPLHIGYMSFEVFVASPTRYYVPGRNFWGAITKRITEFLYDKPARDNYKGIGRKVMENFRFSYFYVYDGKTIYFPQYTNKGLVYGDNNRRITRSEFERRFIRSFVSTAIDTTGTAKDKSLHELEFINNNFRDEDGNVKNTKIIGCIWLKEEAKVNGEKVLLKLNEGIFIKEFNVIEELILGGESKYGFGHVVMESIKKVEFPNLLPFKCENPERMEIRENEFLPAHLKYKKSLHFRGNIEPLTGRGYYDPKTLEKYGDRGKGDQEDKNEETKPGKMISFPEYYFSPGTTIFDDGNFRVKWDGTLEVVENG